MIEIRFDRDWIARHCVAGDITVTGFVESAGNQAKSTPFPIPGYSEVGKQAQPSLASFGNGVLALRQLLQISSDAAALSTEVHQLTIRKASADSTRKYADLRSVVAAASQRTALLDTAQKLVQTLTNQLVSLGTPPGRVDSSGAPGTSSAVTATDTSALGKQRQALSMALDSARQRLASTEKIVAAAAQNDVALRALERSVPKNADWIHSARLLILGRPALQSSIADFTDSSNADALAMIAASANRTSRPLITILKSIASAMNYLEQIPDTTHYDAYADSVFVLNDRLVALSGITPTAVAGNYIRRASLSGLRDAQFSIASSAAAAGDVIVLTVTNTEGGTELSRPYTIRLAVRQFGFVRQVTAPIMLVHRSGVTPETESAAISAASRAFTAGGPPTVDIPATTNFTPAAGSALTWTLHSRTNAFARWLAPGFGVDVSFTTFRTRTITFVAASPVPTQTEKSGSDAVQVAVAPLLTFFDGDIVAGMGWNLNVPTDRFFTAIGFNFLNIIDNLTAHSSSQAK